MTDYNILMDKETEYLYTQTSHTPIAYPTAVLTWRPIASYLTAWMVLTGAVGRGAAEVVDTSGAEDVISVTELGFSFQ